VYQHVPGSLNCTTLLDPSLQEVGAVGIVCGALSFVFKLYRDAKQEQIEDLKTALAKEQENSAKWEKLAWDSVQAQQQANRTAGTATELTKQAVQLVTADRK
jgi:hypothetical protein